MLTVEKEIFFKAPNDTSQYSLRPAKIVNRMNGTYSAELIESDLTVPLGRDVDFFVAEGQEMFVYYEKQRTFVKQLVTIEEVTQAEVKTLHFKLYGSLETAENRQYYRVSTIIGDLTARLGAEQNCKLLDVSVSGFAVATKKQYKPEEIVEATLRYEGEEFSGKACIKSTRPWSRGHGRYGTHHLGPHEGGRELHRGMKKIAMALERQQLRRLAAAN